MTTNTVPTDHPQSSKMELKTATSTPHSNTNKSTTTTTITTATTTDAPSSTSTSLVTTVAVEELVNEAKKAMQSEDYAKACETYADALEIMNAENADPFRPHLAPLYYAYGLCLLNHSIAQSQILGESVPDSHPKEGSSTLEEDSEAEKLAKSKVILFEGDEEDDDDQSQDEKPISSNPSNVKPDHGNENVDDAEVLLTKQPPTEEEIESEKSLEKTIQLYDDLQLAWEVLDMARVIYLNHSSGDKSSSLKLSEVCLALGDVGVESENFDTAIEDYKMALTIKSQWLEKDDRSIAELHFKIACALELAGSDKQKEAACHVQDALDLLKSRGQWIQKQLRMNSHANSLSDETKTRFEQELEDLASLYPDLEAKIEDLTKPAVSLEEATQTAGALFQSTVETTNSLSAGDSGAAAPMDISSLVRKKEKKRDGETMAHAPLTPAETAEASESMKRQKTNESA